METQAVVFGLFLQLFSFLIETIDILCLNICLYNLDEDKE